MPAIQPTVKKTYVCPACFSRDIDVVRLRWDDKEDEYYCPRCAWAGTEDKVEKFIADFVAHRYPGRHMHHPFAQTEAPGNTTPA